ncbi:hypothetical protein F5Y00DRAFT_230254 [Daldinia vernicosa]|uniref:uncharacterized protein n=1 Tax=Daldinia vernicosa TaxID=114800 RepID=UPI0020082FC1|nr:uncharacterized protein F5Y00DRAFT_230254 [Daldinia vernicosa]KAI0851613.1 hypothetical protein F5Y00DRAFT_230254 [Daldinia vernicosa]
MKFALPFELGMLASSIFASNTTTVSPSVYILSTSPPATVALSKALDTLGYSRLDLESDILDQTILSNTYVEVTSNMQLAEIARSQPDAKFILPRGSRHIGEEDYILSARNFFSKEKRSRKFLELDVLALKASSQAENWVQLCDFLGMGYSVVERLGLWQFPK